MFLTQQLAAKLCRLTIDPAPVFVPPLLSPKPMVQQAVEVTRVGQLQQCACAVQQSGWTRPRHHWEVDHPLLLPGVSVKSACLIDLAISCRLSSALLSCGKGGHMQGQISIATCLSRDDVTLPGGLEEVCLFVKCHCEQSIERACCAMCASQKALASPRWPSWPFMHIGDWVVFGLLPCPMHFPSTVTVSERLATRRNLRHSLSWHSWH